MSLKVINPGVLSTIQDMGRSGRRIQGLATGGVLDEHAYLWANRILDNHFNAPVIEITMPPAKFIAKQPTTAAFTGAESQILINGLAVKMWRTQTIKPGDEISIGAAISGMRVYFAVKGGFIGPKKYGSAATVVREKEINPVQAGDKISFSPNSSAAAVRFIAPDYIPAYRDRITLDLISSYQFKRFSEKERSKLFEFEYILSSRMDRMGCLLAGEKINYPAPEIISEGIIPGSVQISNNGQPIILLKDCQTIGGYPKIGVISKISQNKLAQAVPGTGIRFRPIKADVARRELELFYRFFVDES